MPPAMKLTEQIWEPRENRKLLKPLQEKRRRERINQSLELLRTLLLEATGDQRFRNPKAEKAEILKMTVEFLKLQHLPDNSVKEAQKLQRYRSGYRECLLHASQFLRQHPKLSAEKRAYLMGRIDRISQTPQDPQTEQQKAGDSSNPPSPSQVLRRLARGHLAQRCMFHARTPTNPPQALQNSGLSNPRSEAVHCQEPSTSSSVGENSQPRHAAPTRSEGGRKCKRNNEPRMSPSQDPAGAPPSTTVWRPWP